MGDTTDGSEINGSQGVKEYVLPRLNEVEADELEWRIRGQEVGKRSLKDFWLGQGKAQAREQDEGVKRFVGEFATRTKLMDGRYIVTEVYRRRAEGGEQVVRPVGFRPLLEPEVVEEFRAAAETFSKVAESNGRDKGVVPEMVYHVPAHGEQVAADTRVMLKFLVAAGRLTPDELDKITKLALVHDSGEWISIKKLLALISIDQEAAKSPLCDVVWAATEYKEWPQPSAAWQEAMGRLRAGQQDNIKNDLVTVAQMGADFFQTLSLRVNQTPEERKQAGLALAVDFIARFGWLNGSRRVTEDGGIGIDQDYAFLMTRACAGAWAMVDNLGDVARARAWEGFVAVQKELMPGVEFKAQSMEEFLKEMQDRSGEFETGDKKKLLGDPGEAGRLVWDWQGEDWSKDHLEKFYGECLEDYQAVKAAVSHVRTK